MGKLLRDQKIASILLICLLLLPSYDNPAILGTRLDTMAVRFQQRSVLKIGATTSASLRKR